MEMAVKTAERAARSAGRRRGESFPAAGIMGERRPLASLLHGFLGALPHAPSLFGDWVLGDLQRDAPRSKGDELEGFTQVRAALFA